MRARGRRSSQGWRSGPPLTGRFPSCCGGDGRGRARSPRCPRRTGGTPGQARCGTGRALAADGFAEARTVREKHPVAVQQSQIPLRAGHQHEIVGVAERLGPRHDACPRTVDRCQGVGAELRSRHQREGRADPVVTGEDGQYVEEAVQRHRGPHREENCPPVASIMDSTRGDGNGRGSSATAEPSLRYGRHRGNRIPRRPPARSRTPWPTPDSAGRPGPSAPPPPPSRRRHRDLVQRPSRTGGPGVVRVR